MGKKKATVVIAHKMLIACYYILRGDIEYQDLGVSYLEKNSKNKLINHYNLPKIYCYIRLYQRSGLT
ncbi:MAG: hypothetical protein AAF335_05135 [Bacteroidota bacterium]